MTKSSLGILGGGQLARMLALSGHPLGIPISVLAAQSHEPAAQVVGSTRLGSLSDSQDLRKFASDLSHLTFESEFVDIAKLAASVPDSVYVFPALSVIEAIQDRLTQKQLLDQFGLPTSPWLAVENKKDLEKAEARFGKGFVLKQRRFGYDGYGTFVVPAKKHADPQILLKSQAGFIAEQFVSFKRELAVSVVRSRSGKLVVLPLVETVQKNSRCFSVCGPVRHAGLGKLIRSLKNMMQKLDYVGILAIELFDTGSQLVVNELAPRVHNSAHYSQDALTCSQFEYHLRAGLDLPLPQPELLRPGFAMVNLLGEGRSTTHLSYQPIGTLHWYGKSENREGRKLGHINVLGRNPKQALKMALKWRKEFKL